MLVQYLSCGQVEVFLRDVNSSFSECIHSGFCTDTFQFSTRASIHLLCDLSEVDSTGEVHRAGVDAEDICTGFDTGHYRQYVVGTLFVEVILTSEEETQSSGQFALASVVPDQECRVDWWP